MDDASDSMREQQAEITSQEPDNTNGKQEEPPTPYNDTQTLVKDD